MPPVNNEVRGTDYPVLATDTNGFPIERRVANVGHPTYNMQGSYEAFARHGIPQVAVQRSPYARIAYEYGPGGPTPLVGATSVYPHVLYGGYRDYTHRYEPVIPEGHPALGVDFNSLMDRIERMARLRARGGGSGDGGSTQSKRGLKNSGPGDEAINQPLPGTGQPAAETPAVTPTSAPATVTPAPATTPTRESSVIRPVPNVSPNVSGGVQVSHHNPSYRLDIPAIPFPSQQAKQTGNGFLIRPPAATGTTLAPSHRSASPAYETIAVDPSDWNLNYINTLNGLLDALGESGVTAPVTPAPAYTGPTLIRVRPQNAW